MESGRNIISFSFPSNGISSLHNVVPHPLPRLPLIDIYCINSQGAKSTFSSGNEGCSVERYNRLVEEHGNGTENVEFITYLIQGKNNMIRMADRRHRWHQKKSPYHDKDGWTCREYTLSHNVRPCQKHGFTFHLLERIDPRPSYQQVAYCTMTRKRTSTISPAVVPSGDVNSYLSGISSFHGDHVNGSTSIFSGAPIMSMAADSTARMPIMHPGDVTSSFNYGHHFLDSGAYMSMEVNSVPASMPSNCPIVLDAAGGNIWSSLPVSPGRPGIVNDYHLGESYGAVGEGSFPLMDLAIGSEGYNDFGISSTANETSQHDFGVPYMEVTGTGFGTSEYTLPNESGDYNWGW